MPRTLPQFDRRLIGVWSRGLFDSASARCDDVRILFCPNFTGRYETWFNGLNEVITFNWSPPAADRVTLAGLEYIYRADGAVRCEPCDWHFEAVPYSFQPDGSGHKAILQLHFGPQRIDRYALLSESLSGFEEPTF